MKTQKLTTYQSFVCEGRPYLPKLKNGKLLLPNFATCTNTTAIKHKQRLVITSEVLYNCKGLCVTWVASVSCQGYRERWLYWRGETKISWHKLTWDERRKIASAYDRNRENIPVNPPTVNYRKWAAL